MQGFDTRLTYLIWILRKGMTRKKQKSLELIHLLIFRILSSICYISFQTINPMLPIIKNLIGFKTFIINKIIRMQKTYLHSSRTDDYQHLWMHQHLHFTIYSIKRRKKMSKLQNILQKDSFIKFLLSSSAAQGFSQCGEIFSG